MLCCFYTVCIGVVYCAVLCCMCAVCVLCVCCVASSSHGLDDLFLPSSPLHSTDTAKAQHRQSTAQHSTAQHRCAGVLCAQRVPCVLCPGVLVCVCAACALCAAPPHDGPIIHGAAALRQRGKPVCPHATPVPLYVVCTAYIHSTYTMRRAHNTEQDRTGHTAQCTQHRAHGAQHRAHITL